MNMVKAGGWLLTDPADGCHDPSSSVVGVSHRDSLVSSKQARYANSFGLQPPPQRIAASAVFMGDIRG